LIRVVRTPEGEVALDLAGKVHGRGAYVCRKAACIDNAVKRRLLDKALRKNLPAELARNITALGQEHG
jgi:predicted RNA-binding protein YlxR (DUF448 family)